MVLVALRASDSRIGQAGRASPWQQLAMGGFSVLCIACRPGNLLFSSSLDMKLRQFPWTHALLPLLIPAQSPSNCLICPSILKPRLRARLYQIAGYCSCCSFIQAIGLPGLRWAVPRKAYWLSYAKSCVGAQLQAFAAWLIFSYSLSWFFLRRPNACSSNALDTTLTLLQCHLWRLASIRVKQIPTAATVCRQLLLKRRPRKRFWPNLCARYAGKIIQTPPRTSADHRGIRVIYPRCAWPHRAVAIRHAYICRRERGSHR